jgi:CBS domain-containing protein
MVDHGIHQVPIVHDGALLGIVTRADLMRYSQSRSPLADGRAAQAEAIAPQHDTAASHG